MEKIKRLVLGLIPNQKCNLKCEYCYISQVNAWSEPTPLKYPPEYIAKCLSKERLGGTSLINLTGNGETMLQPDIVPLIDALLKEGHYVEVVTNGTITKNINQVLELPKEELSLVGSATNIIVGLVLTPILGIWGVCIASVFCYLSQVIYKFVDVRKFCKIKYNWIKIVPNLLLLTLQVILMSTDKTPLFGLAILVALVLFVINSRDVVKAVKKVVRR